MCPTGWASELGWVGDSEGVLWKPKELQRGESSGEPGKVGNGGRVLGVRPWEATGKKKKGLHYQVFQIKPRGLPVPICAP